MLDSNRAGLKVGCVLLFLQILLAETQKPSTETKFHQGSYLIWHPRVMLGTSWRCSMDYYYVQSWFNQCVIQCVMFLHHLTQTSIVCNLFYWHCKDWIYPGNPIDVATARRSFSNRWTTVFKFLLLKLGDQQTKLEQTVWCCIAVCQVCESET